MATASCATVGGVKSSASFAYAKASYSYCRTVSGAETASGNVPWGGSAAKRKAISWLPTAQTPVLNTDGTFTQPWFQFFREIAINRLGGIDAQTIPQVVASNQQTQSLAVGASTLAVQTVTNINQVVSAVNATAQVTQAAALPGAS
jgi:hypothetical protein